MLHPPGHSLQFFLQVDRKLHTYPIVTSNKLLPIELDTAMSPKPFLATKTLVIRSGILVPAAKNVKPITCKETNY